jgi:AAA+ superfamily predicted ATPase
MVSMTHSAAAPVLKSARWEQVVDGAAVAAGTQAAQQLQRAFQRATARAPAVLFIDCLDALAPARHDLPSTACASRFDAMRNMTLQ